VTKEIFSNEVKLTSRLEHNYQISNKKALFQNLREYLGDKVFTFVPQTFHITDGPSDPKFAEFERFREESGKNIWIIKPGENSNRGSGISVSDDLSKIREIVSKKVSKKSKPRSYII
jgi:hypothetical protein